MSRPRWIHDRRASSRRRPVASATAPARPDARPGGSMTTKRAPTRRARAASRPRRSVKDGRRSPGLRLEDLAAAGDAVAGSGSGPGGSARTGRSTTRRSTDRPENSDPAIDSPSSRLPGVTTTSHSGANPRATASTGSKLHERSSQATIRPAAWASAASRRASVVAPLDASPRRATLADRGSPPGPRMASRAAKPVEMTLPGPGRAAGVSNGPGTPSGTVASAPTTAPTPSPEAAPWPPAAPPAACPARLGAAAPQRAWRVARAAVRSWGWVVIGPQMIEQMFYLSTGTGPPPSAQGP